MSDLSALLAFAHRLADAAAHETVPLFRAALEIDNKLGEDGFDPVTQADRNAEAAIRGLIGQEFPDHGILGEEFDDKKPASSGDDFCWVIDPVDGTRAFISGMASWGTLIALSQNGVPVLGIMDQPYVGERFCAMRDGPALHVRAGKTTPITTRACPALEQATAVTTGPEFLVSPGASAAWDEISTRARLIRYGGDCYNYALLAAGFVDIVIEEGLKPYDIQALIPIVEQAGGIVTNWQGGPAHEGGQVVACGDARLHADIISRLS
ncbi:MAG: histidinol-phosphatase [Parvibaculales bacterium]